MLNESKSTVIDSIPDYPTIQVGKPAMEPVEMDQAPIPTEKVGCMFLTDHLQKYLDEYSQLSDNQAFLDIYQILTLLDHYLSGNSGEHIHCISYNTEYVTLLNQAI